MEIWMLQGLKQNRADAEKGTSPEVAYRRSGWWGNSSIIERFQNFAKCNPDRLALVDDRGREFTNAQLLAESVAMAALLKERGIEPDDVVIIVLPNWVEWQVVHLAIRLLGAIPANIPLKTDARMLAHVVNLVSARCLVGTDVFGGFDLGPVLKHAADSADHRVDVLKISGSGALEWSANSSANPAVKVSDPDLDHIMFTSSTTGMPKAVMHSQDSLNAFHETMASRFDLVPDGSIFMGSPLGHSVGAIHGARMSLYFGLPLILQQKWNAAEAVQMIEKFGCTYTAAATPFLKDLIDLKQTGPLPKLNSLRYFLCGGAQVPPALLERADREFPNTYVTVLWGMTEGGYTTSIPGTSSTVQRHQTAGCASDGLEIVILDEAGKPAGPGCEGDLTVRGPALFYGYYNQPELNEALFDRDGFFFVGDRAVMDEDGYIRITGRSKDLIIRGGVNISPVPIEDVLASHADVTSVAVIGYPDDRLGERICAVFGPSETRLSLDDVTRFAGEHGLAKQHWPEFVFYIDEMPTTPAGKIRKNDVRQWLESTLAAKGQGQ
ncbi:MAG: AMP-binding protein [Rhodobacteraceae bacterium]|nr:AMP-binding protein [Paracoccaceae bacterium]